MGEGEEGSILPRPCLPSPCGHHLSRAFHTEDGALRHFGGEDRGLAEAHGRGRLQGILASFSTSGQAGEHIIYFPSLDCCLPNISVVLYLLGVAEWEHSVSAGRPFLESIQKELPLEAWSELDQVDAVTVPALSGCHRLWRGLARWRSEESASKGPALDSSETVVLCMFLSLDDFSTPEFSMRVFRGVDICVALSK